MHQPLDRKLAVTKDVPVDHVYIPPPDYSMSDELMAVPSGMLFNLLIESLTCACVIVSWQQIC